MLATQRADGWFGPRELLTSLDGKPDLWPHMLMLNVLQSYYEAAGDPRVIEVMSRYFKWENTLPVSAFGEGYWPKIRFGDNIESVFWLYNRTGEPWLLDLARKIHAGMARWDEDVINWHNVNVAQGFRAGTVFWMLSQDPRHLASAERNYEKIFATYGQFPGGGFVGDENSRPGYTDPRGGIETCGIVELMHSFEMLTKITGQPVWADRCEEIAFNTFPAALTPDEKALHYVTCANQIQLDRDNKSPAIRERRHAWFPTAPTRFIVAASTTCRTAGLTTPRNFGWPRPTTACALRSTRPAKSAPRPGTPRRSKSRRKPITLSGTRSSSRSRPPDRRSFPSICACRAGATRPTVSVNGEPVRRDVQAAGFYPAGAGVA